MFLQSSTPPLSDTTSTEPPPAITAALESFGRYHDDILLSMRPGPGWNAQADLCYEALVVDNGTLMPVSAARYRVMACAWRLYALVRAAQLSRRRRDPCTERAAALYRALGTHFRNTIHSGRPFTIDSALAPHDTTKDLYTHAFVLFAAAHWLAVGGDPHTAALMYDAHDVVVRNFVQAGVKPLPVTSMDARLSTTLAGVAQSFVVHLTEAYLVTATFDEPPVWTKTGVRTLTEGILARFVDTRTGSIAELPIDEASTDNRIEPGHQLEWFYFVRAYTDVFTRSEAGLHLAESFARVVDAVCANGVDADTQGVCLPLNLGGTMRGANQRIWAQAEHGRTLAPCTGTQGAIFVRPLPVQSVHFLHAQGWNEVIDPVDQRLHADMPSSTPYHTTTFYEAVCSSLSGSPTRCTQAVE